MFVILFMWFLVVYMISICVCMMFISCVHKFSCVYMVSICVLNDWHRRMKFWHMLPIIDTGDYFLIWINLVYYIMRAKFKISDSVVVFLSSFAPKSPLCIPKENFSPFYRHRSSRACQWRISSNVGVLFFPNKTTTL